MSSKGMLARFALAICAPALLVMAIIGVPTTPALASHDPSVSGFVKDSVTGQPLDNVCVVNGPVAIVCWTFTNSAGFYKMSLTESSPSGQYSIQYFRSGYQSTTRSYAVSGPVTAADVLLVSNTPGQPAPSATPPPGAVFTPPPATTGPAAPAIPVEQRIADFWKRIDALAPTANVSAADLGGWALNVIEREPRARLTAANFRTSTAAMQAGFDRAGLAAPTSATPTAGVEQKIADFWKRIDALQPSAFVSAADLGQWALNVIGREPRAQLSVTDFRSATAAMQSGFDSAGLAP